MAQTSAGRLENFITECGGVSEPESLWADAREFFSSFGATRLIYVHLTPIGALEQDGVEVLSKGCETRRISRYRSRKLYRDDPLIAQALREGGALVWCDIHRMKADHAGQQDVLGFYQATGFEKGVTVPVFGPGGRNGSVTLGFDCACAGLPDDIAGDGAGTAQLQAACQAAHLRHCVLRRAQGPAPPRLSERERELLSWVARGKSNGVIAEILQISPHTVDAYMRRLFLKLGTTDRISAALRALAQGLINAF